MKQISNDLIINQINISYNLIKEYRKYPEKTLNYVHNFIKLMFPESKVFVEYDKEYNLEYLFCLGEPFHLCQAFLKNNICYVSMYYHPVLDNYINLNKIYIEI